MPPGRRSNPSPWQAWEEAMVQHWRTHVQMAADVSASKDLGLDLDLDFDPLKPVIAALIRMGDGRAAVDLLFEWILCDLRTQMTKTVIPKMQLQLGSVSGSGSDCQCEDGDEVLESISALWHGARYYIGVSALLADASVEANADADVKAGAGADAGASSSSNFASIQRELADADAAGHGEMDDDGAAQPQQSAPAPAPAPAPSLHCHFRRRILTTIRTELVNSGSEAQLFPLIRSLCTQSFKLYLAQQRQRQRQRHSESGSDSGSDTDSGVDSDAHTELFVAIPRALTVLANLGIKWAPVGVVLGVVTDAMARHIERLVDPGRGFDHSILGRCNGWLNGAMSEWTASVLGTMQVRQLQLQLQQTLYSLVGTARVKQMFDVIVDYPASLPTLHDMRQCVLQCGSGLVDQLAESLGSEMQRRLLHPGADTSSVIDTYVSTIKSLRVVDPSGAVHAHVSPAIHAYLQMRGDTVRTIAQMLSEGVEDDEEIASLDMDTPASAAHAHAHTPAPSRGILSLLMSVYGSEDVFVNEYRVLLAERLLLQRDYETGREVASMEMLRKRFGRGPLNQCEVMIKDVSDSRRINTRIHDHDRERDTDAAAAAGGGGDLLMDALILSKEFWPTLAEDRCPALHPALARMESEYAARFHLLKHPRQLVWHHDLGSIDLDVEVEVDADADGGGGGGTKTMSFSVPPPIASLLLLFNGDADEPSKVESLTVQEIAAALKINEDIARKRAAYWTARGVLSLTISSDASGGEVYRPSSGVAKSGAAAADMDGEGEGHVVVGGEDVEQYETFVLNMLQNFDGLPLDRIHSMLTMFITDPPFNKSLEELRSILAPLVKEDKIEFAGGEYRLLQQ